MTTVTIPTTIGFFNRLDLAKTGDATGDEAADVELAPVAGNGPPQPEQNFAPSAFWAPHLGQNNGELPSPSHLICSV